MSKRTSKSASGTPGTSSPSGTLGEMAATGKKKGGKARPEIDYSGSRFAYIVDALKQMTPAEFRQSLFEAGIVDENGKLTPMYKR
jgi:hypothetical protein